MPTFTKKLTALWNSEPPWQLNTPRTLKLNQMIEEDKTDGEWEVNPVTTNTPGTHGTVRKFSDQAAAEEFRTWCIAENAKYGRIPISVEITDI